MFTEEQQLNEQVLCGWLSQDVRIRDDKLRTYVDTHVLTYCKYLDP